MKRAIDITLAPNEALDLVEASFLAAPTATERERDRGWTVERTEDRLLVYPTDRLAHLLEPVPDEYIPWNVPETLALVVDAVRVGDGCTGITARIARRRVLEVAAHLAADVILLPLVPFLLTGQLRFLHGFVMLQHRQKRRAAKARLLRIAIAPLLAYQLAPNRGPFRT